MTASGVIYSWLSPSGRLYIGRTVRYLARVRCHRYFARKGKDSPLYRALRKHGTDSGDWGVVCRAPVAALNALEKTAIAWLGARTSDGGLNCTAGGTGGGWNAGKKLTAAHRAAISAGSIGKAGTFGMAGKRHSEKTRRRISVVLRERGIRPPSRRVAL